MQKLSIENIGIENDIIVRCFDQEALCNQLNKNSGKIWLKYYQDPIKMLLGSDQQDNYFEKDDTHKNEILKAAFIFFDSNKNVESEDNFIKEYIISYCASLHPTLISYENIISNVEKLFKINEKENKIDKLINKLINEKILIRKDKLLTVTQSVAEKYKFLSSDLDQRLTKIGYKIIDRINQCQEDELTENQHGKIVLLTKKYFIEVLKRYSLTIINNIYNEDVDPLLFSPESIENLDIFYDIPPVLVLQLQINPVGHIL